MAESIHLRDFTTTTLTGTGPAAFIAAPGAGKRVEVLALWALTNTITAAPVLFRFKDGSNGAAKLQIVTMPPATTTAQDTRGTQYSFDFTAQPIPLTANTSFEADATGSAGSIVATASYRVVAG